MWTAAEAVERRGLLLDFRWTNVKKDDVKQRERERKREREGGAQNFLNSTSSGGLISTFLLPTSFQLVLRTVPPDSICTGRRDRGEITSVE